jgi:hypothetical protein
MYGTALLLKQVLKFVQKIFKQCRKRVWRFVYNLKHVFFKTSTYVVKPALERRLYHKKTSKNGISIKSFKKSPATIECRS